jgi:hypothetical protein
MTKHADAILTLLSLGKIKPWEAKRALATPNSELRAERKARQEAAQRILRERFVT